MINFVTGRPGGGKSLFGVMQICRELETSERYIVTNLPLNLENLAEWCHQRITKPVDLSRRLRVLTDAEVPNFWLYSPEGVITDKVTLPGIGGDWRFPDFSKRSARWPGCLYVIDEVHLFFNARAWAKITQDAEFFMSQHRHLRCDVVLISQHPEKVDKNFRRNAQDFTEIRNLGNEKFLMGVSFNRMFRWATYLDCPRPGSLERPMETGTFRFKVDDYGKLYDTSAGVGLVGKINTGEKRRGRSPLWLVGGIILVIIGGFALPKAIGMVTHGIANNLVQFSGQRVISVVPNVRSNAVAVVQSAPVSNPAPATFGFPVTVPGAPALSAPVARKDRELRVTGMVRFGGSGRIFLSDGREYVLPHSDIVSMSPDGVELRGEGWVPVLTVSSLDRPLGPRL